MKRSPAWPERWENGPLVVFFAALAAAALIVAQLHPARVNPTQLSAYAGADGFGYGWPLPAVRRIERKRIALGLPPGVGYEVHEAALLVNALVSLTIVACTAVVAAYWLGRPQRWFQLSLLECFATTTVVAVLMCFYLNEAAIYDALREPGRQPLHEMPVAALGLGIGMSCTLLAAVWLMYQFAVKLFDRRRRSEPLQIRRP